MAGTRTREIERKYDIGEDDGLPDLLGVAGIASIGSAVVTDLDATYFDTRDLDLARGQVALRRRTGGSDAGWHVKFPAAEGRTEVQWPLSDDGSRVPDAVADEVSRLSDGRPLVPIARVRNDRTTFLLLDGDGALLAELCDDRVEAEDLRTRTERRWREWELELGGAAGDTEHERTRFLDTIESVLLMAGARRSPSVSKLARALGRD